MTISFVYLEVIRFPAKCVLHSDAFNEPKFVRVDLKRIEFAFVCYNFPLERRIEHDGKCDRAVS